jgi:hypothetical protein
VEDGKFMKSYHDNCYRTRNRNIFIFVLTYDLKDYAKTKFLPQKEEKDQRFWK